MSKRIIRIKSGVDLPIKLENLLGRDVHIIKKNDHTQYGMLSDIVAESVTIKDGRDHVHRIDFSEINEVIYDEVSPW